MAAATIPQQEAMIQRLGPILLERGLTYRKFGRAFLKKGVTGEVLETIFDGKVETTRTLEEGDWIVRADTAAKERYSLPDAKFRRLYEAVPVPFEDHPDAAELKAEGFEAFQPCGRCLALVADAALLEEHVPGGQFMASWGSPMLVEEGDFLAAPAPPGGKGKPESIGEVYRIEKSAFANTYVAE
mmetsp:Transcript_135659/g.270691  ORF Transcript_135659/g.270691 Transcript_135659/m.270691 type:complete len:185 (-) Transcript_135659:210-764(-)